MNKDKLVQLIWLAQRYESLEKQWPINTSINNARHLKQMKEQVNSLLPQVTKEDETLILKFFYVHSGKYEQWLNTFNQRVEKIAF